jgi:predicted cupin superfamily sugar epimerase
VASEEVWHHYEGAPLDLHLGDGSVQRIGSVLDGHQAFHVVPAHAWQAARSCGDWTLVGCTVAPGFDFADFEMPDADDPVTATLAELPDGRAFLA